MMRPRLTLLAAGLAFLAAVATDQQAAGQSAVSSAPVSEAAAAAPAAAAPAATVDEAVEEPDNTTANDTTAADVAVTSDAAPDAAVPPIPAAPPVPAVLVEQQQMLMVPDDDDDDDADDDATSIKFFKKRAVINYASMDAGAVVLESSPTSKGFSNLLLDDKDKYGNTPCADRSKMVVIGLSEDIQIREVIIAQYEKYSSHLKEFAVLGSQTYPTKEWLQLGTFVAHYGDREQSFEFADPKWVRYLKVRFLSHHGDEFVCTLSQIKVHGATMMEGFQTDIRKHEDDLNAHLASLVDGVLADHTDKNTELNVTPPSETDQHLNATEPRALTVEVVKEEEGNQSSEDAEVVVVVEGADAAASPSNENESNATTTVDVVVDPVVVACNKTADLNNKTAVKSAMSIVKEKLVGLITTPPVEGALAKESNDTAVEVVADIITPDDVADIVKVPLPAEPEVVVVAKVEEETPPPPEKKQKEDEPPLEEVPAAIVVEEPADVAQEAVVEKPPDVVEVAPEAPAQEEAAKAPPPQAPAADRSNDDKAQPPVTTTTAPLVNETNETVAQAAPSAAAPNVKVVHPMNNGVLVLGDIQEESDCLEQLDFKVFKERMLAKTPKGSSEGQMLGTGGAQFESIFKTLMDKIKVYEIHQQITELYMQQLQQCYAHRLNRMQASTQLAFKKMEAQIDALSTKPKAPDEEAAPEDAEEAPDAAEASSPGGAASSTSAPEEEVVEEEEEPPPSRVVTVVSEPPEPLLFDEARRPACFLATRTESEEAVARRLESLERELLRSVAEVGTWQTRVVLCALASATLVLLAALFSLGSRIENQRVEKKIIIVPQKKRRGAVRYNHLTPKKNNPPAIIITADDDEEEQEQAGTSPRSREPPPVASGLQ